MQIGADSGFETGSRNGCGHSAVLLMHLYGNLPYKSTESLAWSRLTPNEAKNQGMSMKPSLALQTHRTDIRRVVEAHRANNARVFGSVAHGDDIDGSDLDLLIDPTPDTTLFDIGAIRHELRQLLGVPVDVLTPNVLPRSFAPGSSPRR
ncbi:hypothetical protein DFQ28_011088 [Apophysomyces sp. BC1034]|nr:hypothetical protein DFQ28_011088 [Apophysomyces sp. BC1034]